MPSEEEDEIVRRLQARADAMREKPIELILGSPPGPYITPLCTQVGLQGNEGKTELLLETKNGHVILVPISSDALGSLLSLVEHFVRPDEPLN